MTNFEKYFPGRKIDEISRLRAENAELKQNLHDAEMRTDLAEAAETERKIDYRNLQRTLWIARANYCHHFRVDLYIRRHPNTTQTEKSMENKMIIAEMNCWAKAKQLEEYK